MSHRVVVDASFAVQACLEAEGFEPFAAFELAAPSLAWSEALSALHEGRYRGDISAELAAAARRRLDAAPIEAHPSSGLSERAWQIADELGWAKTYDAEYLALAEILDCRLVTLDARLVRGARRGVRVVGPGDLEGVS